MYVCMCVLEKNYDTGYRIYTGFIITDPYYTGI